MAEHSEVEVGSSAADWSVPTALGLAASEEEWLTVLRRAERPLTLGAIGPYQLLGEVSRGAQGVVYRARQPNTNRVIALKRLAAGSLATSAMRARFQREMEAETGLRHPNIVSVYGMEVIDGQPVLAMEWVDGVPLDQWAVGRRSGANCGAAVSAAPDAGETPAPQPQKRDLGEVLRVFLTLCDAVQHAHQRGVIHRDLKPTNILVDAADQPHVLDFGLAKFLRHEGAATAELTQTQDFLGTPAYATPEQFSGDPRAIDVRTDVYALGVILYQMLTGRFPYDVTGPMREVVERILHSPPARPRTFRSDIDDDLETILIKSLAKEPERRYQSPAELAGDIGHYLADEPIEARRDSLGYVFRKQLKRYRIPVAISAGFVLLLAAGLTASLILWRQADKARTAQAQQLARAEIVSAFLKEMLTLPDPAKAKGEEFTLREALDEAAQRIETGYFADQPLVEAEIRVTVGTTYRSLGLYGEAEAQFRRADAIWSRELGERHADTLRTRSLLMHAIWYQTRYDEAIALGEPTLQLQRACLGEDHPQTLETMVRLGELISDAGRFADACALLNEAVERRRLTLGEDHPDTADAMNVLGAVYTWHGQPVKGESFNRRAFEIHSQTLGADHPKTLESMHYLGAALLNSSKNQEAEQVLRACYEAAQRVLGPEHPDTVLYWSDWGASLNNLGRSAEAEPILRRALELISATRGPGHVAVITQQRFLADALVAQGRYEEAEDILRAALETARETFGAEHYDTTVRVMRALGAVLVLQEKYDEAESLYRDASEIVQRTLGGEHTLARQALADLIDVLRKQGRSGEALTLEHELHEWIWAAASKPDADAWTLNSFAWRLLTTEELELRDPDRALELALRANELSGHTNPGFLDTLALAYHQTGDTLNAVEIQKQAVGLLAENDTNRAEIERRLAEFEAAQAVMSEASLEPATDVTDH